VRTFAKSSLAESTALAILSVVVEMISEITISPVFSSG
jgi:hypothetical protein